MRTLFAELEILSAEENRVSYRAKVYHFAREEQQYIEHATFEQVDGRWLYSGGEITDVEVEDDNTTSDDTNEATEEV